MGLSKDISNLLQNRLETFVKDKSVLISLFGEEQQRSKEYNGRQLLELIQNAEDEVNNIEKGDVFIELSSNRLVVANHGSPFTLKGIQSLMTPNVSPKLKQKNKIGVKGLGFRSVLTWAKSITIISKGISVEFSPDIAINKLKELYEAYPDLEIFVKETTDEPFPIPTLSVPQWVDVNDGEFTKYDTYIIVEFAGAEIEKDIQKQIDSLGPEVLLFLSNLTSIDIISPKTTKKIKRVTKPKEKNQTMLVLNESGAEISSKQWTVFSKKGELPESLRVGVHKSKYEYELSMAISPKLDDTINRLFSYFRTDVVFPFPALIHGTFDLTGDRNQIMNNSVNQFLLSSLAELMVNTSLELSKEEISWKPLRLVALNKESNDRLTELGFNTALKREILNKPLFPLNEKRYAKYSERPKWYDTNIAELLPYEKFELFNDLLVFTNDYRIKGLVSELGEIKYSAAEVTSKINSVNEKFSVSERAELMIFLNRNFNEYFPSGTFAKMPSIIIDQHGNTVPDEKNIIMPPDRAILKIPDGIEVSFMHQSLFDKLSTLTKKSIGREIVFSINKFNVVEYAFDPVIREIIRLADKDKTNELSLSVKILKALFVFFKGSILNVEKASSFPKDVNVSLFINGEKQNVSDMYISGAYSTGYVNSLVFTAFKPNILIPSPIEIGLENEDVAEVQEFLKWIGVKEYPSLIKKKLENSVEKQEYLDCILSNLNFPVITEPYKEEASEEEVRAIHLGLYDIEVQSIQYLDEILAKNDSESILSWLNSDPNMLSIISTQKEVNGTVGFSVKSKQYRRSFKRHEVRSYILWKIGQTPWLMSSSGEKHAPNKLIRDKTFKSFSPLINVPEIDLNHPSLKGMRLSLTRIDEQLRDIGINQGFDTIEDSLIYQILNKIVDIFPDGENARMIYSQILQTSLNRKILKNSKAADDYFKTGKVYARMGNSKGYQSINKVYYMPNSTFCKDVLKNFWIMEMDKRRSKERIQDVFGVKPLDVIRFNVHDYSVCDIQDIFDADLDLLKPKLYVYRYDKDADRSELTSLRKLKIFLCSVINADYNIDGGGAEGLEINDYEFIQDATNGNFYIKIPNSIGKDLNKFKSDVRLAESVSDIFNSVLKVIESKKEFIYLFSLSEPQREIVLKSEFGESLQVLEEVKNMFGTIRSQERHFWMGVLEACGHSIEGISIEKRDILASALQKSNSLITHEYLETCANSLNYKIISSASNYSCLFELFNKLSIDILDYNNKSIFPIDFTDLYINQMRVLQKNNSIPLHNALYNKLLKEDIEKEKKLCSLIKKHDQYTDFELENSFKFNTNDLYTSWLKEEFDVNRSELIVSDKDLTSLDVVKERASVFLEKYPVSIDFKMLTQNMEYGSLLLFERYTELNSLLLENGFSEINHDDNNDNEKSNFEDLLNTARTFVEENEIEINDVTSTSGNGDSGSSGSGAGSGSKSKRGTGSGYSNSGNEETGLLAEAFIYELLKKRYGIRNVSWISGNAQKAQVIMSGDDGKGYDIELHYNNEIRYIEVKGTTTDNTEFVISNSEVNFGYNKSNYDLILVTKVKSGKPKFYRFANFLIFQPDDSFLNNKKFTVHNESYKVKLNIDIVKPMVL
jgi:hypothetical protein